MQKKSNAVYNKQRLILVPVILAVIIICIFIYKKVTIETIETTKGMQILSEMEKKKVSDIEAMIKPADTGDTALDAQSVKAKFQGSVVLGESIANELAEYGVLDTSVVIADIGISLPNTGEHIEKAVGLNPGNVFLSYGLNDLFTTDGEPPLFKKEYKEVLDKLKASLPDAKIYVNSITPVQARIAEEQPIYTLNPEFNAALKELCEEEKVTYIDNLDLIHEEWYEQDGIHMRPDYYNSWAQRMIEVAGL